MSIEETISSSSSSISFAKEVGKEVIISASGIDVTAVAEASVMERVEEAVVGFVTAVVPLLVFVEKASVMERVEEGVAALVTEEAVAVAEMVVVIVVVAKTAEKIGEVKLETVAEWRTAAAAVLLEGRVPELVALPPFLGVGEDFVSCANFLELLLRSGFFVFVRMIFYRQFSKRLLHFLIGGGGFDSQNGVMFAFGQRQRDQA